MPSHHRFRAALIVLGVAIVTVGCTVETPGGEGFGYGVSGTVTDATTDRPISGATVRAQGGSGVTSESGFYTIGPLQPGNATVRATHPGYVDAQQEVNVNSLFSPADFKLEPR